MLCDCSLKLLIHLFCLLIHILNTFKLNLNLKDEIQKIEEKVYLMICQCAAIKYKIEVESNTLLGVNRLISVYRCTRPEVDQGSFSCRGLLLRKNLRYEN